MAFDDITEIYDAKAEARRAIDEAYAEANARGDLGMDSVAARIRHRAGEVEFAYSVGQNTFGGDYDLTVDLNGVNRGLSPNDGKMRTALRVLGKIYMPDTLESKIKLAFLHAAEDDLLFDLLRKKRRLGMAGYKLSLSHEEGGNLLDLYSVKDEDSGDEKEIEIPPELADFQKKLARFNRKWKFRQVVSQLMQDYNTCDSMILYWFVEPEETTDSGLSSGDTTPPAPGSKEEILPGVYNVCTINPADVQWSNSLGRDVLKTKLPKEVKDEIKAALYGSIPPEAKQAILQRYPDKYITAVKKNQTYVQLKNSDGDYWIVHTANRANQGLAKPSMFTVFIDLAIRKLMKEGDFAAAFMLKHLILHAKMGESIKTGPMAGSTDLWPSDEDCTALQNKINSLGQASSIVTNHTVEFAFVHPDPEIFKGEKYTKAEANIYNWTGITVVFNTGEGGKYSGGYISIKGMIADVTDIRSDVDWVVTEFFDHRTIRDRIGVPDECLVKVAFDENALKEPTQLLNELKFLFENNMGSPEKGLAETGRNATEYKASRLRAQKENKETGVWDSLGTPVNKQSGIMGRPSNDGNQPDESTRTQKPNSPEAEANKGKSDAGE